MSLSTIKGHMRKQRKGFRSTRANQNEVLEARQYLADINPPQLICNTMAPNIFCYAALADTVTGTIYTDLPGRFPVQSVWNTQYICVCYVYEANAILVKPMKSRNDESFVGAYKEIYKDLKARGFKPTLNLTDNECSKAVQKYITSQNVNYHLVDPNNHWANAAERAIQTFKNYFILGLCSVSTGFLLQLRCYLLHQAQISLNLLWTTRSDSTK